MLFYKFFAKKTSQFIAWMRANPIPAGYSVYEYTNKKAEKKENEDLKRFSLCILKRCEHACENRTSTPSGASSVNEAGSPHAFAAGSS